MRMFLTPFWMKMVYPGKHNPDDHIVFKVHPQMTKYDVQQYLEKLYDVPVMRVRVKSVFNDLKPRKLEKKMVLAPHVDRIKAEPERYEKIAYVHLAPGHTFKFPDIFAEKTPSDTLTKLADQAKKLASAGEDKDYEKVKEHIGTTKPSKTLQKIDKTNRIPSWFLG
ncbi:unnamed protein product [Protopolystoma xenopodis]|uniref:Large ribosomal subunit protein uL23m n=1 Tax=Protopolystoma xenopodis TaxID=117903 RepID=A0A3S5CSA3_9PLAT|nr:unnamed protein product [Protopolystoma xenopodis]